MPFTIEFNNATPLTIGIMTQEYVAQCPNYPGNSYPNIGSWDLDGATDIFAWMRDNCEEGAEYVSFYSGDIEFQCRYYVGSNQRRFCSIHILKNGITVNEILGGARMSDGSTSFYKKYLLIYPTVEEAADNVSGYRRSFYTIPYSGTPSDAVASGTMSWLLDVKEKQDKQIYSILYSDEVLLTGETEDSISVSYCGQALATVSDGTKTLKTNNKVATDNITISDGTNTKKLKCKGKKLTDDITITIQ